MQKQEISNIMIFFVTQDLEGQPRQLEMHLMPEKEVSMMNQRFTEYLQRQREMYKPSLVQSHLPDLYLCRYQFTEDYRLSVTPENAEIFTLLFIREYGLPADFNTNESYKEFTHKGNFKPLDQEMSELQSKKGYSEKAFYNIQNRQQQLADKILGLRYRLTCPPLQLTGPAASEKRKTASRQNKSHNPRI